LLQNWGFIGYFNPLCIPEPGKMQVLIAFEGNIFLLFTLETAGSKALMANTRLPNNY
jgi:hypothetical protein